MYLILILLFSIELVNGAQTNGKEIGSGSGTGAQVRLYSGIQFGTFLQCEGKDVANYTYQDLFDFNLANMCSGPAVPGPKDSTEYLIVNRANGQKVMNILKVLAETSFVFGAYYRQDDLYLVQSGPLEGKFAFMSEIGSIRQSNKACSSVLNHSYKTTKNVFLISENLDPKVFLNPGGVYEAFKKTATTICYGNTFVL